LLLLGGFGVVVKRGVRGPASGLDAGYSDFMFYAALNIILNNYIFRPTSYFTCLGFNL
jgi:hypothetical protein